MNEEIKAASVDTEGFRSILADYYISVQNKDTRGVSVARDTLIAHINAWGEQLAASRAMLPVTDSLVRYCPHCGLIGEPGEEYRDCCPDGIGAFMVPPKFAEQCRATFKLAIESVASPVAGWVSVEDERKPKLNQQLILFVRTVKYGESDDGRQFEDEGYEIAMGEYRKYGELEPQFDCYTSPMSDNDWITHWMPLPPAPVVTPTQQEQS